MLASVSSDGTLSQRSMMLVMSESCALVPIMSLHLNSHTSRIGSAASAAMNAGGRAAMASPAEPAADACYARAFAFHSAMRRQSFLHSSTSSRTPYGLNDSDVPAGPDRDCSA